MKQTKKRTLIAALLLAVSLPAFTHAQNTLVKERNMNTKKILVAFFSRTGENYAVGRIEQGNTHIVAEMIASATGGTLFRIEPAIPYPDDYRACTEIAQREKRSKARPALVGEIAAEEYDVIFLGYPNWWGDLPMPVYTFLERHDWQGKVVILRLKDSYLPNVLAEHCFFDFREARNDKSFFAYVTCLFLAGRVYNGIESLAFLNYSLYL